MVAAPTTASASAVSATAINTAFLIIGCLAWATVIYRMVSGRRHHDPNHRIVTATIACPGTAFLVAAPTVYRNIDQILGIPNLATLAVYSLIVAYSATVVVLSLRWTRSAAVAHRQALRWLTGFALVLLGMAALFATAHVPHENPTDFDAQYGPGGTVGVFLLAYLTAFATGLSRLGYAAWRRSITSASPWHRRGQRILAASQVIAMGYCASKIAYVLIAWTGHHLTGLNDLGICCACLGALGTLTGFLTPDLGPRLWSTSTTGAHSDR